MYFWNVLHLALNTPVFLPFLALNLTIYPLNTFATRRMTVTSQDCFKFGLLKLLTFLNFL